MKINRGKSEFSFNSKAKQVARYFHSESIRRSSVTTGIFIHLKIWLLGKASLALFPCLTY